MIKTGKSIAKARKSFLFLALAILLFVPLKSQNWIGNGSSGTQIFGATTFAGIGGGYFAVPGGAAAGSGTVTLTAGALAPCDAIIIMDMNTGVWERSVVKVNGGTNITVSGPVNNYTAGNTQVILVPQFIDLTLNGNLTTTAWDGTTGGVIWFYCSGTCTINATIDADLLGFTGAATGGLGGLGGAIQVGGGVGGVGGVGEITPANDGADGGGGVAVINGAAGTLGGTGSGPGGGVAGAGGTNGTAGGFGTIFMGSGGGGPAGGTGGSGGANGGTGGTGGGGKAAKAGKAGKAGADGIAAAGTGGRGGGIVYIQAKAVAGGGNVTAIGGAGTGTGGAGGKGGKGGKASGGSKGGKIGGKGGGGGGGGDGGYGGEGGVGGAGSGAGAGGAINIYPAFGGVNVAAGAGGPGGAGGAGGAGQKGGKGGKGGKNSGNGGDGFMGNPGDPGDPGDPGGSNAGVSAATNGNEGIIGNNLFSIADGNWNDCFTWSYTSNGQPNMVVDTRETSIVTIEDGDVVNMNVMDSVASITVGTGVGTGELVWTNPLALLVRGNAGVLVAANGTLNNNGQGAGSGITFDHNAAGQNFVFSNAGAVTIGDLTVTETGGNSVSITTSGAGTIAVERDINTVATSAEFINTGAITIFDDFLSTGANHTLTNTGTITTSGSANADIRWSGTTPIITNTAPGIITTGRNLRFDIGATNGTITNTGTITVGQNIVMGATNGTLTNTGGTINVNRHIRFNQATGVFNNTGIVNITESLRTDFAASTPFVLNNSGTMTITLDFLSSGELNTVNNTGGSITMRDLTSTGDEFKHTNSAPFTVTREASFLGEVTVANGNFNYLIGTGGTGSWVSSGANTLTNILGTWTVQDNMTVGNTSTMNNTGTLTVTAGNVTLGTGNTWTNSATGSTLVTAGNLTIGATSTLNNANVFTVGGNYVSAGDNITLNNTAGTFANTGNMNFGDFVTTVNTASIFNVDGDFQNITSGEVTWNNQAGASTTYAGSTANDPDLDIAANNNANTFNYDRAGDQSIYAPTDAYWHLITSQSGTKTLLANAVVNGDHTRSGTVVVGASTFDIDIKGNWDGTSTGAFVPGTGKVTFSGGAPQAISTAAAAGYEQFNDLTITNTVGGTTFSNDLNLLGDFLFNSATGLTPGLNEVTFNGAGAQALNGSNVPNFYDLTFNSGGAVTLGVGIDIAHNFLMTTAMTHGSQTVTMNGTVAQDINTPAGSPLHGLLISNNIAPTTFSSNMDIEGDFTYNAPAQTLNPSTNLVTFNSPAATQSILGSGTPTFYNLTINNTFGSVTFGTDINVTHNLVTTTAIAHGNKIVDMNGGTAQDISGATVPTFYDLTFSNTGGTTLSNNINIAHDFTNNCATSMVPGTNSVTFNGAVLQTIGGSNTGEFYDILFTNTTAGGTTFSIDIEVGHDFTFNSDQTMTPGTQLVTFNGSVVQALTGTGVPSFYDLTFNNTGPANVVFGTDINVGRHFTATSNFTHGSRLVTLNGSTAQILSGVTAPAFYDLTITNTSGGTTFSNDVTIAHDFTYNSATALTPGTNKVTFDGAVAQALNGTGVPDFYDLTLNNVIAAAVTLGANIRISHDLTTTTTLTHGGQTVTLNGATPQTISGGTPPTFHTLVQDGSGGTTVNTNTSIASLLTLTDGLITPGGGTLKILNGGSASAGGALTYVNGALTKVGNVPFTFPVGSTRYGAVSVSGIGGGSATTELTGEYFDAGPSNSGSLEAGIHHISNLEYWDVSNGTIDVTAATVTLSTTAVSGTTIVPPAVASDLLVVHYESGEWKSVGVGTSGTVTSFSPFAYGSKVAAISLPVELLHFNVNCESNDVVNFDWATGSEVNTGHFEILASTTGESFDSIAFVGAAGNSATEIDYSYSCDNCSLYNCYRLKQVDLDDVSKTFKIQYEYCETSKSVDVFPTMVLDNVSVVLNGYDLKSEEVLLQVYDQTGKLMMEQPLVQAESTISLKSEGVGAGLYFVSINSGNDKITKKVLVR